MFYNIWTWRSEPIFARCFYFYSGLFSVYFVWKAVVLIRLLYWQRERPLSLKECLLSPTTTANSISNTALHGRIVKLTASEGGLQGLKEEFQARVKALLAAANNNFLHEYELRSADLALLRAIAVVTMMLSFVVFTYGFFPTWETQFNNANVTGAQAVFSSLFILFRRLTIGLTVAGAIYGFCAILQRVLDARLASWAYIYRTWQSVDAS